MLLDLQLSLRATPKLLVLCFFFVLANFFLAEAKVRHYKWEVKYEYKSPDCFKKVVITINGRTPGPTIQAQEGDTIIVEVNNSLLTENLAIHWHGIRQIGTPWFDGTEGVTQCPILPGDTFVYQFVVDRVCHKSWTLTILNSLFFIWCMFVNLLKNCNKYKIMVGRRETKNLYMFSMILVSP